MQLKNIDKYYYDGQEKNIIFQNMTCDFSNYNSVAIIGRSGSGKSSLLNILAGLDINYTGGYTLYDNTMHKDLKSLCSLRENKIGMVRQSFDLLDDRNVFKNIELGIVNSSTNKEKKIKEIMSMLDISHLTHRKITSLSGGEKQKVAIARALVKKPDILLADEPTGSLDENSELKIMNIFNQLIESGLKLILVTHNLQLAKMCDVIFKIEEKKVKLIVENNNYKSNN